MRWDIFRSLYCIVLEIEEKVPLYFLKFPDDMSAMLTDNKSYAFVETKAVCEDVVFQIRELDKKVEEEFVYKIIRI